RVARVMKSLGLRARMHRRFRTTTDSRHTKRIAPNLLERDFVADEPNHLPQGAPTALRTCTCAHGWSGLDQPSDGWAWPTHLIKAEPG
ncbi:MAG TPA: hypothetical protein VFX59_10300, partial [Polyangiales bacterium]|nr:hypothetical protein [Polyangiales bacterium]